MHPTQMAANQGEIPYRPSAWRRSTRVAPLCKPMLSGLLVAAACLLGCGSNTAALTRVEGRVLLDGEPLSTGTVVTQTDDGVGARGVIGSDGRFSLETRDRGGGAVPGRHRVAVVAVASSDPGNPDAPSRSLVPQSYASPGSSGLTISVEPGEAMDVSLELFSKVGRRP